MEKKRFSDDATGLGQVQVVGEVVHGPPEGRCEVKIEKENKVTIKKEPSTLEKKSADDDGDEDMTLLDVISRETGSHLQVVVFAGEPSSSTNKPQKTSSDSAPSNGTGKSDANMENGSRDITQMFMPHQSVKKKLNRHHATRQGSLRAILLFLEFH